MQESKQVAGRASLRRVPKQERSRERIGEILKVAKELIGQKGIDAVTMKEIAALSGGPIASVYQYFPNKSAIIAMLYSVYVEDVRELISGHVQKIETAEDALLATGELFEVYYQRMRAEPSTQDLLNAIQADKALADLDIAETRALAEGFFQATSHFVAEAMRESYAQTLFVMFHMAGATLRLALMVPEEAAQLIVQFKSIVRTHATYYLLGRFPETVR
jgi:AcrR family transcriptional regulator